MDHDLLRLLVIEDNPIDAQVIGEFLAHANGTRIECERVERLATGLARLAEQRFDGVLMDLNLPDSSGLETLAQVHACSPHVPIVVLTGLKPEEFGLQAMKAGAEDYLSKDDLEPKLLARAILYAIERAGHRRWHQQYEEEAARYRQLLGSVTSYTYSVALHDGLPASTQHNLGCLSATGYSPQDYATDPYLWIEMVHPDDREMVEQFAVWAQAGKVVAPLEHRIIRRDGTIRWIRNSIFPRRDESGRLTGYDGLVEDISDRKEAELALREQQSQLLAAQEIQSRLWPAAPPDLPGFEIAGAVYPTGFAAGDYFDYVPLLDGSLGLVIADVSGHGLGPALVMALTYAHLRSLAQVNSDRGQILSRLNQFLAKETDHFVTMLFACLMPGRRLLACANAGHPPGFVLDKTGAVKARIESTAMPLGVEPQTVFPASATVALAAGDMILLLTDGIVEARSPAATNFGIERVLEIAAAHRRQPATEIIAAVYRAVCEFCRPNRPTDDITAIVVKVDPDEKDAGHSP